MIEQLLAHLWGDYLLQSHWMAMNKRFQSHAALIHATFYGIAFIPVMLVLPVRNAELAWWAIVWSHFFIDRFGLARYIVWAKNWISPYGFLPWKMCSGTGYSDELEPWLTVWLTIIADNTLHLTCNYLALRFL